jgi:hypothetical protein
MRNTLITDPLAPLAGLLDTIARARGEQGVSLGPAGTAGWLPARLLADPGLPFLDDLVSRAAANTGAGRRAAALLTWKRLSYRITFPVALGWALDRRVPVLDLERVLVEAGPSPRVALSGARTAVLPDDPCAGAPDVIVVEDGSALLAAMRATLVEGTLGPLAIALRRLVRVGEPVLWGSVAAALAQPLVTYAPLLSCDPLTAPQELMASVAPELARLVDLVPLPGTRALALRRRTCCFAFAVPGLEPCQGCPRR